MSAAAANGDFWYINRFGTILGVPLGAPLRVPLGVLPQVYLQVSHKLFPSSVSPSVSFMICLY